MTVVLTEKLLKRFLKLAADRLEGEWVLLGGTVLPFLGHHYRSTTDIDIVPVGEVSTSETLKLMSICEELNLPIETINSAAQYFLQKIEHFDNHLVLLTEGNAKIFRPSVMLFLQLKIGRLSESDFTDCIKMLKAKGHELIHAEKISLLKIIKKARARNTNQSYQDKIDALVKVLNDY